MPYPVVYAPADRPFVEVEVDGTWHHGDLRMWTPTETGWIGQVTWSRAPGENLIGSFPADRIRQVTDCPSETDPDTPPAPAQPS